MATGRNAPGQSIAVRATTLRLLVDLCALAIMVEFAP
jgi:hypothetical protein